MAVKIPSAVAAGVHVMVLCFLLPDQKAGLQLPETSICRYTHICMQAWKAWFTASAMVAAFLQSPTMATLLSGTQRRSSSTRSQRRACHGQQNCVAGSSSSRRSSHPADYGRPRLPRGQVVFHGNALFLKMPEAPTRRRLCSFSGSFWPQIRPAFPQRSRPCPARQSPERLKTNSSPPTTTIFHLF